MPAFPSFLIVFSLLIFIHELGHLATAKLFGVRVDEFGFGYPPRLLKLGRWRETTITLNLLPIGGFVRMWEDDPTVEGSLASKGRSVRALVYAAGALMNLLLAIALFSVIFMVGAVVPVEGPGAGIYYVSPNSPAEAAGLRPGDTITHINGVEIKGRDDVVKLIQDHLGKPIEIVVRRNGQELPPVTLTPRVNPPPNEGAMGVALDLPLGKQSYPVWRAVPLGLRATGNTVLGIFYGVRAAIRGDAAFQLNGPIGIYETTKEVARTGLDRLIEFTAFLSVNLFLVNLLPLPALDGGRLIFVLLEWLRGGRRVPPEKEGFVHALGMIALLALMLVVTYLDYQRYFGG